MSWKTVLALGFVMAAAACGCKPKAVERPYPAPAAETLLARIAAVHEAARSVRAKTVMDYWTGSERVKGTVWLLGERPAKLRFNALSPTGGNVAVDLACDGQNFQYLNYNENCQLGGICDRNSIAQLLRVSFEPDDFLLLSMGTMPLLQNAAATVSWDASAGLEVLTLKNPAGWVQTIRLRNADGFWEPVEAEVLDAEGKTEWKLRNKDFSTVEGAAGTRFRVPGRSQFLQPKVDADLLIRWEERAMNAEIEDDKYVMEIPAGIPECR